MSASLDLPDAAGDVRPASGAWARETHVAERPLRQGRQAVRARAARRAPSTTRSSRCARPTTDEGEGEAYGFSLVYSGNFLAEAEVDAFDTTRVRIGIEPETRSPGRSRRASPSRRPRR